jgi:hypothetical protein
MLACWLTHYQLHPSGWKRSLVARSRAAVPRTLEPLSPEICIEKYQEKRRHFCFPKRNLELTLILHTDQTPNINRCSALPSKPKEF